jgi:hypothetical protein
VAGVRRLPTGTGLVPLASYAVRPLARRV